MVLDIMERRLEMKKRLSYTRLMKVQDDLHSIQKENQDLMGWLFQEIMEEAKIQGFKGGYLIYDGMIPEKLIEVYRNEYERKEIESGHKECESFHSCGGLIKYLEEIMNEEPILSPPPLKTWKVPVTWEVYSTVDVEADTVEEAIELVRCDVDDMPLPTDTYYVDDSFRLSSDDVDEMIAMTKEVK